MPLLDNQLAANRAKAALSRRPKTAKGKRNHSRHGIPAMSSAAITHELHGHAESITDEDPPTRSMPAIKSIAENRALKPRIRHHHRQNSEIIAAVKRSREFYEKKGYSK